MRYFLIFLALSLPAMADDTLDQKIKDLEQKRDKVIADWKTEHTFTKLPNDEYVTAYQKAFSDFFTEETKLYDEVCKANKESCLSEEKKQEMAVASRIALQVIEVENRWAKEGKTETEQQSAVDNFKSCVNENKNCDKLSKEDQDRATAARNPASQKPAAEDKFAEKMTAVKGEVQKILEGLDLEFAKTHPDWDKKEMTEDVKTFLLAREAKELEETLARLNFLCETYPDKPDCTKEGLDKLKDASAGKSCLIERKFLTTTLTGDKVTMRAKLEHDHQSEWDALTAPKDCKVLLEKDKKPVTENPPTTVVNPPTTTEEENGDEKSPRNYKPETCKWATDLPRKIVNGPGCSVKMPNRICTGHVICEQKEGGAKFVRMSTCRPEYCGSKDEDAVRCTKDMRYFSQKPSSESKMFLSPKLKKILESGSGSVQ